MATELYQIADVIIKMDFHEWIFLFIAFAIISIIVKYFDSFISFFSLSSFKNRTDDVEEPDSQPIDERTRYDARVISDKNPDPRPVPVVKKELLKPMKKEDSQKTKNKVDVYQKSEKDKHGIYDTQNKINRKLIEDGQHQKYIQNSSAEQEDEETEDEDGFRQTPN